MQTPADGYVLEDISFSSDCVLTYRELTGEAGSEVIAEATSPCPAGTMIASYAGTTADAEAVDGSFVPSSGNVEADMATVTNVRAEYGPAADVSLADPVARGCIDRSLSRSLSYNAKNGTRVYSTVYYGESACRTFVSSMTVSQGPGTTMYWKKSYYTYPYTDWTHSCQNVRNNPSEGVYRYVNGLGGLYVDETNDWQVCTAGLGTTYSGEAYL